MATKRTPEARVPAPALRLPREDETGEQILRLPHIVALTNLSADTIYRRIRAGEFPPPFKIGKRASGWRWAVVKEHLARLGAAPQ